jgi:hypothetical protein
MIPTQKKVQMPDNLSMKDLNRISYVFSKMSVASKHDFLASLMLDCPNQYVIVIEALGNDYRKAIVQA